MVGQLDARYSERRGCSCYRASLRGRTAMSLAGPSNTNGIVFAVVALVVIVAARFLWAREVNRGRRP
jgi:hypothetical protein